MKRRAFVRRVGGGLAALACPTHLGAQPATPPTIGYLSSATEQGFGHFVMGKVPLAPLFLSSWPFSSPSAPPRATELAADSATSQ
jgi:hypothetical protein